MKRENTDILVSGGGIAGLIATCALAAEGFRVTCVDPLPPVTDFDAPDSDLRSTAFLTPSIEVLERAGLWHALAPFAQELRIMRLADAGGADCAIRETADFDPADIGAERFGYNLPNWLLRREISRRLIEIPGARLLAPAGFAGMVPRLRGAIVSLADGRRIEAALVIGADGRNSAVRQHLGIGVRTWRYGQKALVFNVWHGRPHDGVPTEIHRSGGPFTLVPLPDEDGRHRSAVIWMDAGPRADELFGLSEKAFEAAANRRSCGILGALELASPRRIWPIIAQEAERLTGPRAALIAEASHVIPPIGAQGLNMSLRDIACLRDLLVDARDAGQDFGAPPVLNRYASARRADIAVRVRGVDFLNRMAMAEVPILRDLRRAGLHVLHATGPLRRTAMTAGLGARR